MRESKVIIVGLLLVTQFVLLGVSQVKNTKEQIARGEYILEDIERIRESQRRQEEAIRKIKDKLLKIEQELETWNSGTFESTAYTPACGNGDGYTATMTVPTAGRTIAVDPKVIPLGSRVYIAGRGWHRAEDTGGAIKGEMIDVYMEDREEALGWGRREVQVLWKPER